MEKRLKSISFYLQYNNLFGGQIKFYRSHARWKIQQTTFLKYFSYFFHKMGSDLLYKLSLQETICMICQTPFSEKNKKNIVNLSSAEFFLSSVQVNHHRCHLRVLLYGRNQTHSALTDKTSKHLQKNIKYD